MDAITRRTMLKGTAAAVATGGLAGPQGWCGSIEEKAGGSATSVKAAGVKRPNLIFVFADQLGYTRCGYAGDPKARTPSIDRLAGQGVNFCQAVASMPVCSAYRASLLTGKYTTSTGMVINELRMQTTHECFGHVLTRGGYQTGYIGKWHLYANVLGNHEDPRNSFTPPGPDRLGFDGYWASYGFHHDYYGACYHTNSPEKIFYGEGVYEPDGQTDLAIGYLERSATANRPFAMFLSYGTPHDPWSADNVPPAYRAMFADVDFPNPPNYKATNDPHADTWGRLAPEGRRDLATWRRHYYAMAANLDWNIGRLLAAVDRLGLADDTILVFSSDHGEMFGAQGRRAKNIFYEEAARIPLLVRWPRAITPGTVSEAPICNVDFMPTLLSLMGLPIPRAAEGTDFSHCALGRPGAAPEAAFMQNTGACAAWEDGHEWRALRNRQHTYAIYRADRAELLFDNINDPYQMTNLAGDPRHKATLDRFREMLSAKMKSLNDDFRPCTWYRDHWTKDRIILRTAKG